MEPRWYSHQYGGRQSLEPRVKANIPRPAPSHAIATSSGVLENHVYMLAVETAFNQHYSFLEQLGSFIRVKIIINLKIYLLLYHSILMLSSTFGLIYRCMSPSDWLFGSREFLMLLDSSRPPPLPPSFLRT
ncbi:hypothetical protein RRG08_025121 [Elysia crispata]|uniref:Uncharacterized protein n=1 Tax=Elysia crispata TaxID=231223 RepID=A0AAE1AJQ0_9GAST|nr:hypothetical protein RRG08_025121 [Elysia crispata]